MVGVKLNDLIMPDGTKGKEPAERMLLENPELKVICTSGCSAHIIGKIFSLCEGVDHLTKLFEAHKLAQTVRTRLDALE